MTHDGREGIERNIPWRVILVVVGSLLIGLLAFFWVEYRREEAVRQRLLGEREALAAQAGPPLEALRSRVARLVAAQAGDYAGDRLDPTVDPRSFAGRMGLYLRLPLEQAKARTTLERAARTARADALPGCLGLDAPRFGRILVESTVISPEYKQTILDAPNRTRLEVLAEDFRVRTRRDLEPLARQLKAEYLLVVLEEPAQGARQWFRVLLWDMTRPGDEPLARARTQSTAQLMPVRWLDGKRWPPDAKPDQQAQNTAEDCAIASAIKPLPPAVEGSASPSAAEVPTTGGAPAPGSAAPAAPGARGAQ